MCKLYNSLIINKVNFQATIEVHLVFINLNQVLFLQFSTYFICSKFKIILSITCFTPPLSLDSVM